MEMVMVSASHTAKSSTAKFFNPLVAPLVLCIRGRCFVRGTPSTTHHTLAHLCRTMPKSLLLIGSRWYVAGTRLLRYSKIDSSPGTFFDALGQAVPAVTFAFKDVVNLLQ